MTIASRPRLLLAVPGGPPRCPGRLQIEEAFLARPFGEVLATTLPSIGPRAGAGILAETGDGTRIATYSGLAACAGLALVTWQPGTSPVGCAVMALTYAQATPPYGAGCLTR